MKDKKSHCLTNLAIKLCDFKMDLIKWQLNLGLCHFGLKSYLWFQIELALRARSILKSRIWFQTKLLSTPVQLPLLIPLSWFDLFTRICITLITTPAWTPSLVKTNLVPWVFISYCACWLGQGEQRCWLRGCGENQPLVNTYLYNIW